MTSAQTESTGMDISEIKKLIPHRYPFLFVDRVISCDLDAGEIIAHKMVSANELFFEGHFPERPIMPGVLIIEALAQAGSIFISKKGMDGLKVLARVNNFKFRSPVYPGDLLELKLTTIHSSSFGGKSRGVAMVGDKICAEGEMMFSVIKEKGKNTDDKNS